MNNVELVRHRDALVSTIDKARTLQDLELQGHWGKYVCVLTSGFLENIIRVLYGGYAQKKGTPKISAFVVKHLERISNPKSSKFLEIASSFDDRWGGELSVFLDEDGAKRRNAIDSIVANRHLIAHGRNVTITVARVKGFLAAIIEVADFIEGQCTR